MEIRQAKISEIKQLQVLTKAVINQNYRTFLGDAAVDFFINSGSNDEYIEQNIGNTKVAVVNHQIIGICVCIDECIDLMMIHNDYQNQGWGSQFIKKISHELFSTYSLLRVECFAKNQKANQYYVKNGWREIKRMFDQELNDARIYYVLEKQDAL